MRIGTVIVIMVLILIVWSLHSMDLEYYTNVGTYNEAFDNNLKVSFFSIFFIVALLLISETEDINTTLQNN